MLPNLSTKYVSQFTLVIATAVTYAACINPLPFLFENFAFKNHLVLSPWRSSLTLSPPLFKEKKEIKLNYKLNYKTITIIYKSYEHSIMGLSPHTNF